MSNNFAALIWFPCDCCSASSTKACSMSSSEVPPSGMERGGKRRFDPPSTESIVPVPDELASIAVGALPAVPLRPLATANGKSSSRRTRFHRRRRAPSRSAAPAGHGKRQIVRLQQRAILEKHRALQRILQLAHISRPAVIQQQPPRLLVQPLHILAKLPVVMLHEEIDERRQVFFSLAQRRKKNRNNGQPVIQILTKMAFTHSALE